MCISKIIIKRYKGVKDIELDFGDTTILRGRNGAGKTTICEAIYWTLFGHGIRGEKINPRYYNGKEYTNDIIEVSVILTNDGSRTTFTHIFKGGHNYYKVNDIQKDAIIFGSDLNSLINIDEFEYMSISSLSFFCDTLKNEDRIRFISKYIKPINREEYNISDRDFENINDIIETLKRNIKSAERDSVKYNNIIEDNILTDDEAKLLDIKIDYQEIIKSISDKDKLININKRLINDAKFLREELNKGIKQRLKQIEELKSSVNENQLCKVCGSRLTAETIDRINTAKIDAVQKEIDAMITKGKREASKEVISKLEQEKEQLEAGKAKIEYEYSGIDFLKVAISKEKAKKLEDNKNKREALSKKLEEYDESLNKFFRIKDDIDRRYAEEINKYFYPLHFDNIKKGIGSDSKAFDLCMQINGINIPYRYLSMGEKIKAQLIFADKASELAKTRIPIIIDNSECYKSSVDIGNQIILLRASNYTLKVKTINK